MNFVVWLYVSAHLQTIEHAFMIFREAIYDLSWTTSGSRVRTSNICRRRLIGIQVGCMRRGGILGVLRQFCRDRWRQRLCRARVRNEPPIHLTVLTIWDLAASSRLDDGTGRRASLVMDSALSSLPPTHLHRVQVRRVRDRNGLGLQPPCAVVLSPSWNGARCCP